ncbi:hypothetical protein AAEO56_11405 [Flavobacterium sp. DGU11]|uniref:Uncharacterized protein n=1 Tax=Flavobacterium arundinis TaxID=3139143 RepID=A0ABU9HY06_9FLAO
MKYLILYLLLIISGCKNESGNTPASKDDAMEENADTVETPSGQAETPTPTDEAVDISLWDFNGDGQPDDEITVPVVEGTGNPVEDGTPGKFTITFDNKTLPNLAVGCCNPMPVGEGDLNGDGAAELSVFQSPMNGCVYTMTTYTFRNGKWRQLFEPFLVPTGCDEIRMEDLEKLVYRKNGKVYIMETDVNDEDFKKNPKEVKL